MNITYMTHTTSGNGMLRNTLLLIMLLLAFQDATAQTDRKLIRQGNRQFRNQHYEEAEATYRKASAANAQNPEAQYNLGCALMAQQKDSMAMKCFQNSAQLHTDKQRKAQAYHNMGVILQQKKQFGEAAEAYKAALRNNPKDNETRYNLALCLKQMKNQPKQNQNQKKDENKDKNKDKEKEKNENKNQKDQKQPEEKPEQMSKENAEQLLNAAMQQEKATQQRMKKAQQQPSRKRHLQNW
ncbi:MAG: tetratricopeptide repeat protein [Bacteroidales bacterium]|nr:tetratricopeptide repeat protein [Bacteroidales bacterium]MDY4926411.1 tetratricopeptide repeat protein [Prevotella sp.]